MSQEKTLRPKKCSALQIKLQSVLEGFTYSLAWDSSWLLWRVSSFFSSQKLERDPIPRVTDQVRLPPYLLLTSKQKISPMLGLMELLYNVRILCGGTGEFGALSVVGVAGKKLWNMGSHELICTSFLSLLQNVMVLSIWHVGLYIFVVL